MKSLVEGLVVAFLVFLVSGCASAPIVQPTYEEMQAAREHKKTVAIFEVEDKESSIKGVKNSVRAKLENNLMRYFNLVERERIKNVIAERNFSASRGVEKYTQIGKMLGADFLIFATSSASLGSPQIDFYKHKYDSGKFRGRIWEEVCAQGQVELKVVDVSNGIVVYSDSKTEDKCSKFNKERFKDQSLFEESLKTRRRTSQFIKIADRFSRLQKGYIQIVSQALGKAVNRLTVEMKSFIPQTGEIVRFVSDKKVVVNLGSAYGIKPGDILTVWKKGISFTDPKTGIVTTPKTKKAYLKVIEVSSGLSSVAKVSGRVSGRLNIGDKVYTQR